MPGPRVYTVEEVNELIPDLERRFARLDEIRERLKTAKIKLDALEMIWGDAIHKHDNPDHKEFEHHLETLKRLEDEFQTASASFGELSATVKGLDPGLLDFYGVRDGRLVFLCWRRGEVKCEFWHHVDAGFSGRQPV
jgi:hypothetical protein